MKSKKKRTIHTARTMMLSELSQVMDHNVEGVEFSEIMNANVSNKLSSSNLIQTNRHLKQLYSFDNNDILFKSFRHYWQLSNNVNRGILTLLFALTNDYLLSESIDVVISTEIGRKVAIETLGENIERYHPGRYSDNTRRSAAQNIASSWKQAGYIEGRIKNIRTDANPDYTTVSFALLLSYINGDRGEFILSSKWVKALALNTEELRDLIKEAAKRDMLQYQHAGSVTIISFDKQLKLIEYNGK